jgi:hypothetical protein
MLAHLAVAAVARHLVPLAEVATGALDASRVLHLLATLSLVLALLPQLLETALAMPHEYSLE